MGLGDNRFSLGDQRVVPGCADGYELVVLGLPRRAKLLMPCRGFTNDLVVAQLPFTDESLASFPALGHVLVMQLLRESQQARGRVHACCVIIADRGCAFPRILDDARKGEGCQLGLGTLVVCYCGCRRQLGTVVVCFCGCQRGLGTLVVCFCGFQRGLGTLVIPSEEAGKGIARKTLGCCCPVAPHPYVREQ